MTAAIAWLKKWWKWILFPIGIGVAILSARKTKVNVTSSELQGHAELDADLSTKAVEQKTQAGVVREMRHRVALDNYDASVAKAQAEATSQVTRVGNDPVRLNDYLKKVGKNVRSPKN